MDDLIFEYKRLLRLLEEDEERIALSLQGDFLEKYRFILKKEKEMIETQIRKLYNR